MRIAVLGATSQIGKDLIFNLSGDANYEMILYSRRPDYVMSWQESVGINNKYVSLDFSCFSLDDEFDAIVNFVGVGDPARAAAMGQSILDTTQKYDEIALQYIKKHSDCRYIFLSSGAVYGSNFDVPVNNESEAILNINNITPQDWYAVAKLCAELRHRALTELSIVDVRVFNYFSHTQDINAKFLASQILKAIKDRKIFITSPNNIVRDYLHPLDFCELIKLVLISPPRNCALDCYSKSPIDKISLLNALQSRYGLSYEISDQLGILNATGWKQNYFSENRIALELGYKPEWSSLTGLTAEFDKFLTLDK